MEKSGFISGIVPALALALVLTATSAAANHRSGHTKGGDTGGETGGPATSVADYDWMRSDVAGARSSFGFNGAGTTITVIDDFTSTSLLWGRTHSDGTSWDARRPQRHGEWTREMAWMVAPGATIASIDLNSGIAFVPTTDAFNAVNLSYGLIARTSFASAFNNWDLLGNPHSGVLAAVQGDLAFAAKAAGNDATAIGGTVKGTVDVFAQQFVNVIDGWTGTGAAPVIFVGALEWNPDGTEGGGTLERLASYSNYAGSDPNVQGNFLVVGVEGGRSSADAFANYGSACGSVDNGTCLYGTSFAAPIVTGYAAIVAQKFTSGTTPPAPSMVAAQLLSTALTETISGYDPALHGQGEACLSCALGPDSLTAN